MEQATLRPVPLRPSGPVDPREAFEHVAAALPGLDEAAVEALALVEIAGRSRAGAASETGLAPDSLAEMLFRARKALRRSIFPLSASGWCERAERLISDRIDGVLVPPGQARLGAHLRNCDRCVEHERALARARETLVRDFIASHPHADVPVRDAGPRGAAGLRVVAAVVVSEPLQVMPSFAGPTLAAGAHEPPIASFAGPGGQVELVAPEPIADEVAPDDEPDVLEDEIAPAEPADATPSERSVDEPDIDESEPAAEVELEPEPEPELPPPASSPARVAPPVIVAHRSNGAELLWNVALGAAVFLAFIAVVVTVLAIAGVDRVF
jgi:hypothetical protein